MVQEGEDVSEGQTLLMMEALKMEMKIPAPSSGKIQEICVQDGSQVQSNQVLVRLS